MNIVLFGFKNSGKGFVGKKLAKMLDRNFIDTDDIIEDIYFEKNGKRLSYRQIATEHGLEFFRELEKDAVKRISEKDGIVIAVGGGTPLFYNNAELLKKKGKMVLLTCQKDMLFKRIMEKGLPPFLDPNDPRGSFEKLLKERMPKFEKIADYKVVSDDRKAEDIAKDVIETMGIENN